MSTSTGFQPSRTPLQLTRRVLLAEENENDLRSYCAVLQRQGYEVLACGAWSDAMSLLADGHFDFIVVSQGTCAFEGRCVLERSVEINRRVPVLILAAWHDMRCYLDAMQLGAIDYLEKPRNAVDLARFVDAHMPPAQLGGKS